MMTSARIAVLAALVTTPALAQMPGGATNSKRQAAQAVQATNAHTTQMQSPTATPQRPAAQAPGTQRPAAPPANAAHPQPNAQRPGAPAPAARPGAPANAPRPGAARGPRVAAADTATPDTLRIEYRREVFNYGGGPRDPFQTLISSGAVRPTIDDLKLISVAYDARGGNSVAVVRETMPGGAKRMHRLRRGDQLGRLRVIQIQPYQIVFQIEEFGFERQQTLTLQRPEVAR